MSPLWLIYLYEEAMLKLEPASFIAFGFLNVMAKEKQTMYSIIMFGQLMVPASTLARQSITFLHSWIFLCSWVLDSCCPAASQLQ